MGKLINALAVYSQAHKKPVKPVIFLFFVFLFCFAFRIFAFSHFAFRIFSLLLLAFLISHFAYFRNIFKDLVKQLAHLGFLFSHAGFECYDLPSVHEAQAVAEVGLPPRGPELLPFAGVPLSLLVGALLQLLCRPA